MKKLPICFNIEEIALFADGTEFNVDCYCIMVKTGSEEKFRDSAVQKLAQSRDGSKFYFFKKQMKARSGATFMEPLFPGYIFMETQNLERSTIETLKQINGFYHFLFDNANPQKLQGNDLTYYTSFRSDGEVLGISRARFDENQRIKIVEGPLLGFEGKIIRVNRRCQRVTVEIDMFGYSKKVDLCYSDAVAV